MLDKRHEVPRKDMAKRWGAYGKIERAVSKMGAYAPGPRYEVAALALCAAAASWTTGLVLYPDGLTFFGFDVLSPFFVGPLTALIVAMIWRFSSLKKDWKQVVDECLVKYVPVDKDAFRELQEKIQAEGWDHSILVWWLSCEGTAIRRLDNPNPPEAEGEFLSRKL